MTCDKFKKIAKHTGNYAYPHPLLGLYENIHNTTAKYDTGATGKLSN